MDLLIARAAAGECELIVKGTVMDEQRGWLRRSDGQFVGDRSADAPLGDAALRAVAATAGQELTYTCVPVGSGTRAAIDRDEDGFLDRDELDAGSDPADPNSTPLTAPTMIRTSKLILKDDVQPPLDPAKRRVTFIAVTTGDAQSQQVVPPLPASTGDPTAGGATLVVFNAAGLTTDVVTVNLPAGGWKALGSSQSPKGWRFRGAAGSPISTVVVEHDRITVRGGNSGWGYSLNEATQGQVALRLQLGNDPGWCTATSAALSGNPPSTAKSDRPGLFNARQGGAAPASCPALPGS